MSRLGGGTFVLPRGLLGVVPMRPTMESALFEVMNGWLDIARFGADVQRVMALRMMRLASGGPAAANEAQRMVSEKVAAFGEAQLALATVLASGGGLDAAAARAYAPYRRRVRANRQRLGN